MNRRFPFIVLSAVFALVLAACNDSNDAALRDYRITLTNLSNGQPVSPLAVVLHRTGYRAFVPGQAASDAVEALAEGGDPGPLLSAAMVDARVLDSGRTDAALAPGASAILRLGTGAGDVHLSLLGMLVKTNDGFVALDDVDLSAIASGQQTVYHGLVYDAGTEANSETAATVPGLGGQGLDSQRDDIDRIVVHAGVVSRDDGLASSGLTEAERFDNPALRVVVERL